jgi:hypothetical protein
MHLCDKEARKSGTAVAQSELPWCFRQSIVMAPHEAAMQKEQGASDCVTGWPG